jgi:hypothetical protein
MVSCRRELTQLKEESKATCRAAERELMEIQKMISSVKSKAENAVSLVASGGSSKSNGRSSSW